MNRVVAYMFGEVTAKLEDLHSVAVEGQCTDNAPDMQCALNAHLQSGVVVLGETLRAMMKMLEASRS